MEVVYIMTQARFTSDTSIDNLLNNNLKYEYGIKIGYSKNLSRRLSHYSTGSYGYIHLFTIENATVNDEKRLHQYFKKYLSNKGSRNREWFVWNNEIYNFFKDHKTIEEIRKIIPEIKISNHEIKEYKKPITPILNIMVDNGIGFNKSDFPGLSNSEIVIKLLDKYVTETQYFETREEFIDFLRDDLSEEEINIILDELSKAYSAIEKELEDFNNINFYHDKMKYVCEAGKVMEKNKFNLFLDSIPISFKNYYTVLGPDRCSAAKFQKGEMEKVYQVMVSNQGIDIRSEIYATFNVGDRITKADIKQTLAKIYNALGYKKTARAIDLEEFFVTKPIMLSNPDTKKRDNGLELISKKVI